MASGENSTDFSQSYFSSLAPFTTQDTLTTASSLSLSLTAATSTDGPPLSSVTWGTVESSSIFSESAFASSIPFSTAHSSASSSSTAPLFTSTTFDPTTSSFVTSSGEPSNSLLDTSSSSQIETSESSFTREQSTITKSSQAATTTSRESSSSAKRVSSSITASQTWSQFTTTGQITTDGRVVVVTYTSSDLVAVTQATTIKPSTTQTAVKDSKDSKDSSGGGTKTSTKIAVGVVVPVGALSLGALGFYYLRRRNKRTSLASEISPSERESEDTGVRGHFKHNSINAHHMF